MSLYKKIMPFFDGAFTFLQDVFVDEVGEKFVTDIQERLGTPPSGGGCLQYDAMLVLGNGLDRAIVRELNYELPETLHR